MQTSLGFERSIQTLQAVKDYGWTYPSNYLDIYFEKISAEENISWMHVSEHCIGSDGLMSMPALGVFVDVGLSNAARATLGQKASLATVALRLGIRRQPGVGNLKAVSKVSANIDDTQMGAAFTQVEVFTEHGELLASGSALMGLAPFKNSLNVDALPDAPRKFAALAACLPGAKTYNPLIYAAAQRAQQQVEHKGAAFIDHFWGAQLLSDSHAEPSLRFYRGHHLANRAGNVHGGVLYGLAAQAASAVVPAGWRVAESSVQYLNAASDEYFETRLEVLRQGRNTVVVNCQIVSNENKKVLHSQWTFLKPQD